MSVNAVYFLFEGSVIPMCKLSLL